MRPKRGVRLPRPVRHERGEGWGEGCSTLARRLAVAERLLSPALSSVPHGGEGAGGPGADGTNFRNDCYGGSARMRPGAGAWAHLFPELPAAPPLARAVCAPLGTAARGRSTATSRLTKAVTSHRTPKAATPVAGRPPGWSAPARRIRDRRSPAGGDWRTAKPDHRIGPPPGRRGPAADQRTRVRGSGAANPRCFTRKSSPIAAPPRGIGAAPFPVSAGLRTSGRKDRYNHSQPMSGNV